MVLPGVGALRGVHGGPATTAASTTSPSDRDRRRAARSSASVSGCRCCSRGPTRTPGVPGLGVVARARSGGCPTAVKHPQMQWNLPRRVRRPSPMLAGLDEPSWIYFVHSYARRCAEADDRGRHLRLRRPGRRPPSSTATCGPPSSTPRSRATPACRCWPTSSTSVAGRGGLMDLYPGHRPPRTASASGCTRATTTRRRSTATTRSPRPGRSPPPVPRGSTSSISTPPAPASRRTATVDRPRSSTRSTCRCRSGAACARSAAAAACSSSGVARVVIGTAAVEHPELVAEVAAVGPVAVGLDVRGGEVAVHGWEEGSGRDLVELVGGPATMRASTRSSSPRSPATAPSRAPTSTGLADWRWRRPRCRSSPPVASARSTHLDDLAASRRRPASLAGRHRRPGPLRGHGRRSADAPSPAGRTARAVTRADGPRHPLPRRRRRPGGQGRQLRRPRRRRRSGRAGRALRRRGRRRAGVPRHHRVVATPRHHRRGGPPHRRGGLHPVHRRRRHPHRSTTPGALLRAGADKVAVNTAAVERPELITEIAAEFGAPVCGRGHRRPPARDRSALRGVHPRRPHAHRASTPSSGRRDVVRSGAGEILLTSMDRDGTRDGFDIELTRAVTEAVRRPGDRQRGSRARSITWPKASPRAAPTPCSPRRSSTSASTPSARPRTTWRPGASRCVAEEVEHEVGGGLVAAQHQM